MADKKQKRNVRKVLKMARTTFLWLILLGSLVALIYSFVVHVIVTDAEKKAAAQSYTQEVAALLQQYKADMPALQSAWEADQLDPAGYMQKLTDIRDALSNGEYNLWLDQGIQAIVSANQEVKYGFVRLAMPWGENRPEKDGNGVYTFDKDSSLNFIYLGPNGAGTAGVPPEVGAQELVKLTAFLGANGITVLNIGMVAEGDKKAFGKDVPAIAEFTYELNSSFATQQQ